MAGIGEQLRAARLARGLSLQDVQTEVRIREKYLRALEAEEFDALPGPVYARAFLRSYAHHLGLDAEALVQMMPEPAVPRDQAPKPAVRKQPAIVPLTAPHPPLPRQRQRRPSQQWPWVVLPILFLAALLYYFGTQHASPTAGGPPQPHHRTKHHAHQKGGGGSSGGSSGSQASLTQLPQTQAAPPLGGPQDNYVAAKGPITATLAVSGPCWVYAQQDGTVVMEQLQTGGTYTFTANQSLFIKLGDPSTAQLTVDGENVTPHSANAESVSVQVQG